MTASPELPEPRRAAAGLRAELSDASRSSRRQALLSGSPALSPRCRSSQTTLVSGGPDALLQLEGQGLLGSRPAVIAGDKLPATPALWADTDGQRRADTTSDSPATPSPSHTPPARSIPPDDPLGGGGGPPRQLLPVAAAGHQTVAVLAGARASRRHPPAPGSQSRRSTPPPTLSTAIRPPPGLRPAPRLRSASGSRSTSDRMSTCRPDRNPAAGRLRDSVHCQSAASRHVGR